VSWRLRDFTGCPSVEGFSYVRFGADFVAKAE
jgi:hypothetical protein